MLNGITFILLNVLSIKMLNLFFDFKIIHFVLFIFLPKFFSPIFIFGIFAKEERTESEVEGSSGRDHKTGFELGLPEAQLRYKSERCPQGYRAILRLKTK